MRSSASLPIILVSIPSTPLAGILNTLGLARRRTYAFIGFSFPLTFTGSVGRMSKIPCTRRYVSWEISMPPTGAWLSRRLAVLTVSPIAVNSPVVPILPRRAGPLLTPILNLRWFSVFNSLSRAQISSCMARAALRAHSGSFSLDVSAPHIAITLSPMCLSIVPPFSTITLSSRSQRRFMISVTSSASMVSDIEVKPEMSAKSIVTCLRCSCSACKGSRALSLSLSAEMEVSTATSPRIDLWDSRVSIAFSSFSLSVIFPLRSRVPA